MKILITGVCGMVGSHMVDYFFEQGTRVIGTYYKPVIDLNEIRGKADLIECDVRYYKNVLEIINEHRPEKIFHLAAQSYPTVSWDKADATFDTNVNGTVNICEAVKFIQKIDKNYNPVIVIACSSAEYGASLTPENVPIKETAQLLPLHPYGVSKVAQDLLGFQYFQNDGLKTIRARIFNTTGPRKLDDVVSDFTKRAVLVEKGLEKTLKVGNLETRRAITDVRDLAPALILLSDKGKWGDVYNISGESVYLIKDIITVIENYMERKFEIEVDKKLLRPTDEPIIYGDSTKIKQETGWKQSYTLENTVADMIEYWRKKL